VKKLIHLALIAWLCCGVAHAQDRVQVQRVITIKNTNLGIITRTIHDLLPGTGVLVTSDNEHLILSGPKDAVNGFEEIIKQLDVPAPVKKNIETTVYMIVASTQASASSTIPAQLDPVVTQLKAVFAYKGYRLLDSFVLRSRDGERGDTSGFVPPLPDTNVSASNKIIYQFKYSRVTTSGNDKERLVRFDRISLGMKVPVSMNTKGDISYVEAGISTDVDVPEGKKVVVGKTSAVEGSDSALILVISAKVVD
jgi:type II secretory pathway component GspD/PulD (secretin)